MFPNPANDFLYLITTYSEAHKNSEIIIYNTGGNAVFYAKNLDKNRIINVSHFTPGVYFIKVDSIVKKLNIVH